VDAVTQGILALLVILCLLMAWAIIEIRSLRAAVQPIGTIADSPIGRAVAGLSL
jgi:hypothetical protein